MVSYVKFVSGLYCADVSLTVVIVVRYMAIVVPYHVITSFLLRVSISLYMHKDYACRLHCGHL